MAGVGGIGGLARGKSFFQKTLEAPGGAFLASLGCVGGGGGCPPRIASPRIVSRAGWGRLFAGGTDGGAGWVLAGFGGRWGCGLAG